MKLNKMQFFKAPLKIIQDLPKSSACPFEKTTNQVENYLGFALLHATARSCYNNLLCKIDNTRTCSYLESSGEQCIMELLKFIKTVLDGIPGYRSTDFFPPKRLLNF